MKLPKFVYWCNYTESAKYEKCPLAEKGRCGIPHPSIKCNEKKYKLVERMIEEKIKKQVNYTVTGVTRTELLQELKQLIEKAKEKI